MAKKNEEQEPQDTTVAKKLGRTRKKTAVNGTPVPPRRTGRINGNPYATASAAPTPYKMTPAAQKAAGVTKPRTLRTTRLKTDVGLTAIPSPISLMPKKPKSILKGRKMKAQAIQEDKICVLTGDIDAPQSSHCRFQLLTHVTSNPTLTDTALTSLPNLWLVNTSATCCRRGISFINWSQGKDEDALAVERINKSELGPWLES